MKKDNIDKLYLYPKFICQNLKFNPGLQYPMNYFLVKIKKPNEKRQYRQTLYPKFIYQNLKSTFI